MTKTVIDLTGAQPPVDDERDSYSIDWETTLVACRMGEDTLVVTASGEVLLVRVRLKKLLAAFASRHFFTSDENWSALQRLYRDRYRTPARMTRSYVNLDYALVPYAGGTSVQAGYYMAHRLSEAIARLRGVELVFTGGVRVLTNAIPRTQRRLAEEAEGIGHLERQFMSYVGCDSRGDPTSQRAAERVAIDYRQYVFEHQYRVHERRILSQPDDLEWL